MSPVLVSQVALWVCFAGLALVVLALARQIGILHERIAPVGALKTGGGPDVGEASPHFSGLTLQGEPFAVGGVSASGRPMLLFFVSPDCPICKVLLPVVSSVAAAERLDLMLMGDGEPEAQRRLLADFSLGRVPFVNGSEIGMAFRVDKLPYAVLIDEAGTIAAKGLVNSREHLESLAVAKQTGFRSVQHYLEQTKSVA